MSSVLVLTSSASGAGSVSTRLVNEAVEQLRASNPGLHVISRDLDANPIPHLTADANVAVRGEPVTEAQQRARRLSDDLIAELKAADTIVIGAPMYNFGIPSTLKSWFDHVLRPGVTFTYGADGPRGLLPGKKAIVIESRGGLYSEGPAQAMDSQEPHLRTMLGFAGITDVSFVRAEKLGMGDVEDALAAARLQLNDAVEAARLAA
jgi:FMN-dependent NADH-azoreductase